LITTSKGFDIQKTEIDVSNLSYIIKDILYALYNSGYEEVKLNYNDPELTEKIQLVLQNEMIGFEIVELRRNYCVIKAIAGGFEKEFENMFRRTFLLIKSMAEDLLKCMESGDMTLIHSIKLREVNTNKYTAFCRRIIQKKGYKDTRRSILMYMIVQELEEVGDEYKYLCDYFADTKGKAIKNIKKDVLQLFKTLNEYMDKVYFVYYNFNLQEVNKLFQFRKGFINEIHKVVTPRTGNEGRLGHYLTNITQELTNVITFKLMMEI